MTLPGGWPRLTIVATGPTNFTSEIRFPSEISFTSDLWAPAPRRGCAIHLESRCFCGCPARRPTKRAVSSAALSTVDGSDTIPHTHTCGPRH